MLAIDSQRVKIVAFTSEETGIDGGKKVNGRKRTLIVDTNGLPLAIKVRAANISDNAAGILAVDLLAGKTERLKIITVDAGYKTTFKDYTEAKYSCTVEVMQKPESSTGFVSQKNRWQVERSFSWLNFCRRLLRDVENTVLSAEAMIQIAFISFCINSL